MSVNPMFHARSKHIELDYHFVREKVAMGHLVTRYIPSLSQPADIFTKPLAKDAFQVFRSKLGVLSTSHANLRGHVKNDNNSTYQATNISGGQLYNQSSNQSANQRNQSSNQSANQGNQYVQIMSQLHNQSSND